MYLKLFHDQANLFKSLAHPRRLEIIHLLRDQEFDVTQIYTMLDLPQANISQHLSLMRRRGLVLSRREGKNIYYCLTSSKIILASDLLRSLLQEKDAKLKTDATSSAQLKDLVPLTHDPVCGMQVSSKTAAFTVEYRARTFYFCASGCLKKFQKSPKAYVKN